MIRQKQYRDNALPSYLDQITKAQTHSILRAREAQQDYRGGLILTLKHPACSSYIIFSLPAVPLVSLFLLECPCRLPASFYIKVQFLISSSRPHVALSELAPSFLSHPTQCLLSTSPPPQPPPPPCSHDSAPSPLLSPHNLIHLPRACPQDSFTAASLPALMTSTSPPPLASFAPSDY